MDGLPASDVMEFLADRSARQGCSKLAFDGQGPAECWRPKPDDFVNPAWPLLISWFGPTPCVF